MVFAHEFNVKPSIEDKRKRRKYYPEAPSTSDRVVFYDKQLSNSFGSRFSFEPFVDKKDNECVNQGEECVEKGNNKRIRLLVKKKQYK